jgi:hypothetical protein
MSNIKHIHTDSDLVIQCANLLNLSICNQRSTTSIVVLNGGDVFDPINNMSDWGIVINAMIKNDFDFAIDHDGIIVNSSAGMVTFNDDSVGRRLVKSFVELFPKTNNQGVIYANS